jgi:metallo-beta-lactamase class B
LKPLAGAHRWTPEVVKLGRLSTLSLLALGGAGLAYAQSLAQTALWGKPADPFRVIGNVYYVGSEGLASWLIVTPEGHVLIDGGMDSCAPIVEANIRTLGYQLADVKILLNSHAHFDHAGALAKIKADTKAVLLASAGDKPLLEGGYYPGAEDNERLNFPPVKVDKVIEENQTVRLGHVTLTAHLTPGHTPGCTTWTMPVTEAGKPHEIVFFCSATVAANRLVGKPSYAGIVEDYRRTFMDGQKIKADVFLAPHPEMYDFVEKRARLLVNRKAGNPDNAFVDPGAYNAYLSALQEDFERQLKVQTGAQAGQ